MMKSIFKGLVSPKTRMPVYQNHEVLCTADGGEKFEITDGIACLCDKGSLSDSVKEQQQIFNALELQNVSYFTEALYRKIAELIRCYAQRIDSLKIAELGGGEGHWARFMAHYFPKSEVFLCDVSHKTLERAPESLRKVCADVTQPIFEGNTLNVACFWVSLHHLDAGDIKKCILEVYQALDHNGILVIFEPNNSFALRHFVYSSSLKRDVYIDAHEKSINFETLSQYARETGFVEQYVSFLNPPYALNFVNKLKKWPIYFLGVSMLYYLDQFILEPLFNALHLSRLKKFFTLYGCTIYIKK